MVPYKAKIVDEFDKEGEPVGKVIRFDDERVPDVPLSDGELAMLRETVERQKSGTLDDGDLPFSDEYSPTILTLAHKLNLAGVDQIDFADDEFDWVLP